MSCRLCIPVTVLIVMITCSVKCRPFCGACWFARAPIPVKTLAKEPLPPFFELSSASWPLTHSTCHNLLLGVRPSGSKCDVRRTGEVCVNNTDLIVGYSRRRYVLILLEYCSAICRGKAVPLQAWSGPEGSRKLRFPYFMATVQDGGKVVSLTHRPPLRPGNAPDTHFC